MIKRVYRQDPPIGVHKVAIPEEDRKIFKEDFIRDIEEGFDLDSLPPPTEESLTDYYHSEMCYNDYYNG